MARAAGAVPHLPRISRAATDAALPALLAAVLVAIAIGVAARAATGSVGPLGAGSPEATVSTYLRAWGAGDAETAWALLAPSAQARIGWPDFRDAVVDPDRERVVSVVATGSTMSGARTWLRLEIVRSGGGFMGGGWEHDHTSVVLEPAPGGWSIVTPLVGIETW
jgi:hypothetical protein